jgi:hypothetical protein
MGVDPYLLLGQNKDKNATPFRCFHTIGEAFFCSLLKFKI